MKPIEHLCYRVFGDDSRLGVLRKRIAHYWRNRSFVDDAVHSGIIAMVQDCGESVFHMTQDQIFKTLTGHAGRCYAKLVYSDIKHGMVAGSGRIKGQHFNYATSIFNNDGSLKKEIINHPVNIPSPERALIKKEVTEEYDIIRKKAVARVIEIMREIIGDVDIEDIVSVRDGYTTGRRGIGAGLAVTLGIHERTMQRRLISFKKHLSEDETLQQLLKEIL
jgi:hypothetical protein